MILLISDVLADRLNIAVNEIKSGSISVGKGVNRKRNMALRNIKQTNKNILYGFFRLLCNFGQGGRRYPALAINEAKDLLGLMLAEIRGWMHAP